MIACGSAPASPPLSPAPAQPSGPSHEGSAKEDTAIPAEAVPALAAPAKLYPLGEAIADATSGPLEFIGMGPWPGTFRRFSCAYRNERVIVVEHHCMPNTRTDIRVQILSPKGGSVAVTAQAKKGVITGQERAAYRDMFGGSSGGGHAINLKMSYEKIVATTQDKSTRDTGVCTYRLDSGAKCYQTFEDKLSEFTADADAFFKEPGAGWYKLVEEVAKARARPKEPIAGGLEIARDVIAVYARALGFDLTQESLKRVGQESALFSAALLLGGGEYLVAITRPMRKGDRGFRRGKRVAAALHLDKYGKPLSSVNLLPGRYDQHDHPFIVRTPDGGFALLAWPGKKGGLHSASTLGKFSKDGKAEWQWTGKIRYDAQVARVQPDGSFLLRGHVNPPDGSDARGWKATISATGKLISEDEGGPPIFEP
jgi:hypothetical protein